MARKQPAADQPQEPNLQQPAASESSPGLVRMKRDPEQFPAPHSADVHPNEVANYAAAGWQFA